MTIAVPPVSVEILRTGSGLVVGQARTVECQVTGARPNHRVSWWKNGQELSYAQSQVRLNGYWVVGTMGT